MRTITLLLLLFLGSEGRRFLGAKRLTLRDDRWRRQDACSARSRGNTSRPAHISEDQCCDGRLDSLLRQESDGASDRLGDTARNIQRRVQLLLGHSYEVIISRGDFSVSSHYHGQRVCKVRSGDYHILAYETPVPYNQNDVEQENILAAVDADDDLGSTLPENLRGRFPDVRLDSTAGENLVDQPSIEMARANVLNGAVAGAGHGNQTWFRQGGDITSADGLPIDTYCTHEDTGGNQCCSGALYTVMDDAIRELSTSPSFGGEKTPGVVANLIKNRVQKRFERAFEVFVSFGNFERASHMVGDHTCKFNSQGLTVMAYETPDASRYDHTNQAEEDQFSSLSDGDPLGTSEENLPGQRSTRQTLNREPRGARAGFPKGSHCGPSRLGSRCCNLALFNAMESTLSQMFSSSDFNPFNRRLIARNLRDASEDAIGSSVETVVSCDDFVVSSHGDDDMCKFRIGEYYVMAWKTPVRYPLHEEHYADNGQTTIVGCDNSGYVQLKGSACCSGELRYTMTRAMDEANNHQVSKMNTDTVSRAIVRAAQMRFNTRFETVVSRGDFVWNSPGHAESNNVCKLDLVDFHALTFQSSNVPPAEGEFITGDIASTDGSSIAIQNAEPPGQGNAVAENSQAFVQNAQPAQPEVAQQQQVIFQEQPAQQVFPQQQINQPFARGDFFAQQAFAQPAAADPAAAYSGYYYPAGFAAGGGGGGGACFSEDTWVTTPTGKKNMATLELGDYVLTANTTTPYYAQVTVWMHRDPEKLEKFITIMTDYGKMLRLTRKHLIFRNICDDDYAEYIETVPASGEEVFAHELRKGDCLVLLYKGKWRQQRIKELTKTRRKGIYAPLTTNGRIIVNDILASCYADVKGPTLQTSYFELISFLRQKYYDLTGYLSGSKIELPFSTDLWKDLLNLVIP